MQKLLDFKYYYLVEFFFQVRLINIIIISCKINYLHNSFHKEFPINK